MLHSPFIRQMIQRFGCTSYVHFLSVPGHFFTKYPRHDRLISINKRHTGKTNKEFNMRHDWNSLLSDDDSMLMKEYSREFFPPKSTLVKYLNDYQQRFGIKVQHNTEVRDVRQVESDSEEGNNLFYMEDQLGTTYSCRLVSPRGWGMMSQRWGSHTAAG